jgi:hypothetical protein
VNSAAEANPFVPVPGAGKIAIVIHRDATQQAGNWAIF